MLMNRWRTAVLSAVLVTLVGCENLSSKQTSAQPLPEQLENLQRWEIRGKLGVKTSQDSASTSVKWQQQAADQYQINLVGPLGQGNVEIIGEPKLVSVSIKGETYTSSSARALLSEQLGWDLPVEQFQYWVKGVPSPNRAIDAVSYSAEGSIDSLSQDGWLIIYDKYEDFEHWRLPSKLTASFNSLKLTLIIRDWSFNTAG